jgi:large subunit ribosomal protein L9
MKVILKEDVKDLGVMGSVVDVANGYGRNYLIPRNLAAEANPRNIQQMEHDKSIILSKVEKIKAAADELANNVSSIKVTIEAKAGEEDKLFGSVTTKDIAEAVAEQGFDVDKRKIQLEEPIKRLGEYEVSIKLHHDVVASVKVEVKKSEESEA